jgi:glycosyltransferase involved in cell wall biosynthesis
VRILLVSQMYPGPAAPTLGTFVAELEHALEERGHELARAVVDGRGGRGRHLRLLADTVRVSRTFRPEVVYAHFLVPAGLWAVLGTRAPVVLTAHGQDVENALARAGVRAATRVAVRRASHVIAVSRWLRDRLLDVAPEAAGRVDVIDCGVDTIRFAPRDRDTARARLGWHPEGTGFLCLGSLTERKNVLRLATAVEERGEGDLVFVGEGPLRPALTGRARITLAGPASRDEVSDWIAACDVLCQPSLVEPFGLATLEAMAGGRSVVASLIGGQPEFVTPAAGPLVDPLDPDSLAVGLDAAAALPRPNLAAREAALDHDLRRQAERVEEILLRAARGRRA